MAQEYADKINAIFMIVSAKTGDNIDNLFNILEDEYLRKKNREETQELKQISK